MVVLELRLHVPELNKAWGATLWLQCDHESHQKDDIFQKVDQYLKILNQMCQLTVMMLIRVFANTSDFAGPFFLSKRPRVVHVALATAGLLLFCAGYRVSHWHLRRLLTLNPNFHSNSDRTWVRFASLKRKENRKRPKKNKKTGS